MDFEAIAKKYKNFYSPNYKILIDGRDVLEGRTIEILNVTFEDVLEGADRFSFSVNDPGSGWLDSDLFEPGVMVEIKMGYLDVLITMIVGEIISLRPSFPADGTPQLEVSGYDLSHQFTKVRKQRSFEDTKDSEIVASIAREAKHKLKTEIDPTETVHHHVVQDGQTDYDFINGLAERNFFEFFVREKTLYFQKPKKDGGEIATLKYGVSLSSFNPELNTANQVSEVTVMGWNPQTREKIVGRASGGSEEARANGGRSGGELVESQYGVVEERISDRPVFTQEEAEILARSILNKQSVGLVKGGAECIGIPDIKAGKTIELKGLGKKFSRRYYIERTTHNISTTGYSTTFNITENTI